MASDSGIVFSISGFVRRDSSRGLHCIHLFADLLPSTGSGHRPFGSIPLMSEDDTTEQLVVTLGGLRISRAASIHQGRRVVQTTIDEVGPDDPLYGPAAGGSSSASSTAESVPPLEQISFDSPVPPLVLATGKKLYSTKVALSGSERIQRAWRAGLVARAALAAGRHSPLAEATPDLPGLPSTVFLVLAPISSRCGTLPRFSKLLRTIPPGSRQIIADFPSLAEADAYCQAAGVDLPALIQ